MNALVAIQAELKAPKDQTNAHGKYKYRKAEDILEALKPILKAHNCAVVLSDEIVCVGGVCEHSISYNTHQDYANSDDGFPVSSEVTHGRVYVKSTATLHSFADGMQFSATGYAREAQRKKGMDDAQLTGSCSSYAKKYALCNLFAIDNGEDDADTKDNTQKKANYNVPPKAPATAPEKPKEKPEPNPEEQIEREKYRDTIIGIIESYPDQNLRQLAFKLTDTIDTIGRFLDWSIKHPTSGKLETFKNAVKALRDETAKLDKGE